MIPGIIYDDSSLKYYFDAAYSARKLCGKPCFSLASGRIRTSAPHKECRVKKEDFPPWENIFPFSPCILHFYSYLSTLNIANPS